MLHAAKRGKNYENDKHEIGSQVGQGSSSLDFPWNMIEAVHGMPNLGVSQGQTYVFNQRPEEDEVALPQPPRNRVQHRPPATEPGSSPPPAATLAIPVQCLDNHRCDPTPFKVDSLRSTAKAGRKRPASLEQVVSWS